MAAGDSARRRSVELEREAEEYTQLALLTRQQAANYRAAAKSETGLAAQLRPLSELGWQVLEDRLWPGSKRANVDFILIGPPGVMVVDAKNWRDLTIKENSVYCGQECMDEDLENTDRLMGTLAESVSTIGLTAAAMTAVWAFTGRSLKAQVGPVTLMGEDGLCSWLLGMKRRLTDEQIHVVSGLLDAECPELLAEPTPSRFRASPPRRPQLRSAPQPPLPSLEDLSEKHLSQALSAPIESWMTFLHPSQNKLIRTHWNGPARVRGPAGTGKTVVALHRAVYLAQRSTRPVLFTTYVRSLNGVLESLASRIDSAAAENIEFHNVHSLAHSCLKELHQQVNIDSNKVETAFSTAWSNTAGRSRLTALNCVPGYWRDEIDHVIKGRCVDSFQDYAQLTRIGRKTPLRAEDRALMWQLYLEYQAQLADRGLDDFNDLLLKAHEAVAHLSERFRYSSVIIDEVQDLPLAALRFLDALSGDGPNRLLLVGDGEQSIYPGGFSLTEAGISVVGRASVLRNNYRNTREVLEFAQKVIASDSFNDLEGGVVGPESVETSRRGERPMISQAGSLAQIQRLLINRVRVILDKGSRPGDIAVLARTRTDVNSSARALRDAGIDVELLSDYAGVESPAVKVGTFKRAKGLEFDSVFLPGITAGDPPRLAGESADAHAERSALARRELYVAMTRARDHLWLGYLEPEPQGARAEPR